jgi:hypothetical protein
VTSDALIVDLLDGRTISVPLAWYPRLAHGSDTERSHWRLIGEGEGIHWRDFDEDISVSATSSSSSWEAKTVSAQPSQSATQSCCVGAVSTRRAFVAGQVLTLR